ASRRKVEHARRRRRVAEDAPTAQEALRRGVVARLPDRVSHHLASNWCLEILLQNAESARPFRRQLEKDYDFPYLLRLLWQVPVLLLLAADGIHAQFEYGESLAVLSPRLPPAPICDAAAQIP